MRAVALALLLGGCGFPTTAANTTGGSGGDDDTGPPADAYVPIDSPPLQTNMPVCLGDFNNICVDPPKAAVAITQNINTDNVGVCLPYTSRTAIDACVIAGTSITIASGAKIIAAGNKKLILFATTDDITIAGSLDAASHAGQSGGGPAADVGPCTNGTNAQQPQGGGYGGSFAGAGNNGGTGANNGGVGGIGAAAIAVGDVLRAGCAGGDGQGAGGNRGHGGGALYLLAKKTISISGTVNASGAGGDGGTLGLFLSGAGGGGGSGGMIVLEAATVNVPGKCFANGGGGGGGASGLSAGRAGGESSGPASRGSGGNGGTTNAGGLGGGTGTGGNGGDGAYSQTGSQPGTSGGGNGAAAGAGGGAGGGDGYIKILAGQTDDIDDDHVSPLPVQN